MNDPTVTRLRAVLAEMGASRVDQQGDGPFRNETYVVERVHVALQSDYGSWRANLSLDGHPFFPASFWLAALSGSRDLPVPAVTEEDLPRLTACLDQIVARAPELALAVEAMGEDYRAAMRDGLS